MIFAWNLSIGNFRLGSFTWDLSLGIFGSGSFEMLRLETAARDRSLGNLDLRFPAWEPSLGNFRFGIPAWELLLGTFSLGTFAWACSLEPPRLGSEALGTGLLRLGKTAAAGGTSGGTRGNLGDRIWRPTRKTIKILYNQKKSDSEPHGVRWCIFQVVSPWSPRLSQGVPGC